MIVVVIEPTCQSKIGENHNFEICRVSPRGGMNRRLAICPRLRERLAACLHFGNAARWESERNQP